MTTDASQRNIKLTIAYNGCAYHGWQRQARHLPTVQQSIENIATRVMGHRVVLHGAGRTDTGVHAEGQVANFRSPNLEIPLSGMRRAINARLPEDILIRSAVEVPMGFHSSLSAVGKTYRYRIFIGPERPVALAGHVYHYIRHPLDIPAMAAAGRALLGAHDFRALATSAEKRDNTVRTIYRCEVALMGQEVRVTVQGNGFLHNMVRNLVGTLIEVGRGRWRPNEMQRILATLDRAEAGPTAPAGGLTMVCVHYDDSVK